MAWVIVTASSTHYALGAHVESHDDAVRWIETNGWVACKGPLYNESDRATYVRRDHIEAVYKVP